MKKWLFIFLCSFTLLSGEELRFKDRLEKAKCGDFFVTQTNKMITLAAIRSISPSTLLLEEISVPEQNLKPLPDSSTAWTSWIKAKAPGHTSWSMIEIDLENGQVLECYSFSRSAWIQFSQKESFLSTLLLLPLKPVDPDKRRRIGPPPLDGEPDRRKVWNPPMIADGKKIDRAEFEAFETEWPKDGSELSGKTITLYFDKDKRVPLPYWIQVDTAHATAALRTIDSGKNLPSPFRTLPRRAPDFIGLPEKTQSGLRLSLKCPRYYHSFDLFAIDLTDGGKEIPIPFAYNRQEGELLRFEIERSELEKTLKKGHRYAWLAIPIGQSHFSAESLPFQY
jgi:hypothetical protein